VLGLFKFSYFVRKKKTKVGGGLWMTISKGFTDFFLVHYTSSSPFFLSPQQKLSSKFCPAKNFKLAKRLGEKFGDFVCELFG
jgi:hypothetical protein